MGTVIRLKRRVDEDPLNAFVLNCKRQRVDGSAVDDSNANEGTGTSTILKFAGTFTQAEGIASHIQTIHKDQAKETLSRVHRPNITSRNRLATKQTAQDSRFKIVNCTRSIANASSEQSDCPITTIVDVERDTVRIEEIPSEPDMPALEDAVPHVVNPANGDGMRNMPPHPPQPQLPYFTEDGVHYVYDLYVADTSQNGTHIPYYTDNLEDLRLVLIEDAYFAFYSFI